MSERKIKRRKLTKYSIGDMRDKISLEQRSITPPVFGSSAFTEEYIILGNPWASVETINQKNEQSFSDVALDGEHGTHRFVIRFRSDVTTETRIRWNDVLYEIVNIDNPQERNQYLALTSKLLGSDSKEANQ